MKLNNSDPLFEAPIPGQSFTMEIGSTPWQNPPKLSTIDEVAMHYINAMTDPSFTDNAVNVLESGVPVVTVANIMQTYNVMEGLHSLDLGILASPIIVEYLMYIGDTHGIEYTSGLSEKVEDDTEMLTNVSLGRMKKNVNDNDLEYTNDEITDEKNSSRGIMSKTEIMVEEKEQ